MLDPVVESYRLLVGSLLDHTFIGHEGHENALGDFEESDDRAMPILRQIMELQKLQHSEDLAC
jgi:hypothetical protein